MPYDPGQAALDGRSNGASIVTALSGAQTTIQDGQVLPWRPVKQYRPVHDSRDRAVARNSGTLGQAGYGGPNAGTVWDTPSTLDGVTILSEIWNVVYVDPTGNDWTGMDILIELFKHLKGFDKPATTAPVVS